MLNQFNENQKIALVGAAAFIIGLIIGLPVLGWWLFPVEWENAGPAELSSPSQIDYVRMVADSFASTNDLTTAQERMAKLGPDASKALQDAINTSSGPDGLRLLTLQTAVGATLPPAGSASGGSGNMLASLLPVCATILLLAAVIGGGIYVYRRLQAGGGQPARPRPEVTQGTVAERVDTPPEISAEAGAEPVTTFKTTYMLGNDLFDESFSIDDQQGDFLGECGVSIGETIGVGDPKRVTAFEVWLFDKNDIRTVTKVVMSEHAFNDEGLKSKLAAKGEPVIARSDGIIEMETATLKVQARVVDMQYGSGALPTNSFFQQLTLEISAWKKSDL